MHKLAIFQSGRYSCHVPEKKGNEFGDSNFTKAHRPRNAAFLCAYVIASFLRAAVAGIPSGMPGSFVSGSPTLPFAAHPFGDGGSVIIAQRNLL